MTGPELKQIRQRLGLSTTALGRAFGYAGGDVFTSGTIRKYESGQRPIPPWLGRLAIMFDRHGVPPGWTASPIKTDDNTKHGDLIWSTCPLRTKTSKSAKRRSSS
ncbi:helix-turn-helix domain-containing protein [Devosia sp. MC521]|nr:helix-turn-helix domain-containing protein [Devosia sp. MC521]QMW61441.1 helix-turn-helix domain-containing protein [Devosia sp. MC521]